MTHSELAQPLVFEPIFMERVWGGRRLESLYGKRLPPAVPIGESWEIVDRPEAQSVVHDGPLHGATLHELWTKHRETLFGEVPDAPRFPILCKLLDAQENLSLQVHPPREIARALDGESKTELWYIIDAAPRARLYAGLKKGTTRQEFRDALMSGEIETHLHALEVRRGDAMFLPSGRMHALGAGIALVEIQENSDTTYRIYDWGRTGREMHLDKAMESIDFGDIEPGLVSPANESLLRHESFEIEKWDLLRPRKITSNGTFAIVVCLSGSVSCGGRSFSAGDFFLVPACATNPVLEPQQEKTALLVVRLPS